MDGFIFLHRKVMESFVFANPYVFKLWLYCLMTATYKDGEVLMGTTRVPLARGQFFWGRQSAAAALNRGAPAAEKKSASTWENYLKLLEQEGLLRRETGRRGTLVTVKNYDAYQGGFDRSLAGSKGNETGISADSASRQLTTGGTDFPISADKITNSAGFPPPADSVPATSEAVVTGFSAPATEKFDNHLSAPSAETAPVDSSLTTTNADRAHFFSENPKKLNTNNNYNNLRRGGCSIPENYKGAPLDPYDMFEKAYPRPMTQLIAQSIDGWVRDFGGQAEIVGYAIELAGLNGASSPRYFESILRSWEKQGVRTLAEAQRLSREREEAQEAKLAERLEEEQMARRLQRLPRDKLPVVSMHNWLKEKEG